MTIMEACDHISQTRMVVRDISVEFGDDSGEFKAAFDALWQLEKMLLIRKLREDNGQQ